MRFRMTLNGWEIEKPMITSCMYVESINEENGYNAKGRICESDWFREKTVGYCFQVLVP